jgi:hypothetical protein
MEIRPGAPFMEFKDDNFSRKKARGTAAAPQVPRCDAPNLRFINTELNHIFGFLWKFEKK